MRFVIVFLGLMAGPMAAQAEFAPVSERGRFVSLIEGKDLTRFGIRLEVTPDGRIRGRAFGRDVTGAWRWAGGYFCRDLYWGSMELGANCQAVRTRGDTLRFISDQGTGQYADLYLR
ncbi:MAG: dihydrodipicolinate reductase [Roseovarius sp.]|nr:dihydrodipicolinate reductase [Roseovarius sp.]